MRPYLAILIDSFRAALASWVLYVLLALILLLLVILAPLHVRESLDWKLQFEKHFKNPQRVAEQLVSRGQSGDNPAVARIWELLKDDTRKTMRSIVEGENPAEIEGYDPGQDVPRYFALINDLNEIINQRDFYRPEDWEGVSLDQETQALIDEGPSTLSEERSRRLNRLLVGRALPAIAEGAPTTMTIYYAWFTHENFSFSMTRQEVASNANQMTSVLLDKFVLSLGILIGILVTANIIPETFDAGSLNLLLSKPIPRWALFLTKFFGGCALIALCTVLLFAGIWLWMGLAIGVWDVAFLWSIPLYILVFAIYYSVSAFVGLTYRSSIMAVIMTLLFWAVCYGVGSGYGFLHARMQNARLYDPVLWDQPLALDGVGTLVEWDPNERQWERPYEPNFAGAGDAQVALAIVVWVDQLKERPFRLTPVVDGQGQAYVGSQFLLNPLGANYQDFNTAPAGGSFDQYGKFPSDAMGLFALDQGVLVVDRDGNFYQLDPQKLLTANNEETPAEADGVPPAEESNVSAENVIERLGPDHPVRVASRFTVSYNPTNDEVAIYRYEDREHRIYVFKRVGDEYQQDRSVAFELGTDVSIKCYLEYKGSTLMVVGGNGQVITFDAQTLKERRGYLPESRVGIETLTGSPDGRWFALGYANQNLWMLDTENDEQIVKPSVRGQGNVSSVAFDRQSQLCVVDREDRLTVYDPATLKVVDTYDASGGLIENLYRYVVHPLYRVFPKPGEFYKVVRHLSSTRDTRDNTSIDLIGEKATPDPYAPLWSGLLFMAVMLGLSCWVFQRRDY